MRVENVCHLAEFKGVEREWELSKGVPRSAGFTANATLKMDENYPYDTLLADNLDNRSRLLVVSGKLKSFLESRTLKQVE